MPYTVRVKQGHPTGVRRRSGLTFTQDESMVSDANMTTEIRADPWLQVRVVAEPLTATAEREAAEAAERANAEAAERKDPSTQEAAHSTDEADADVDDPAPRRGRKK